MAHAARSIQAQTPEQRALATESLRVLSVNCAYTRSALQLPVALHQVVMDIDSDSFEAFVQSDWLYLQQGLTQHVEVLDALGVDLPMPARGQHLYSRDLGVIIDRETLQSSVDPIAATRTLLQAVPDIAEEADEDTRVFIEDHSSRVEDATGVIRQCPRGPWSVSPGHPWTLGGQLNGWHDVLRRVQPFTKDPATEERVSALVALLDDYVAATDAHVGGR